MEMIQVHQDLMNIRMMMMRRKQDLEFMITRECLVGQTVSKWRDHNSSTMMRLIILNASLLLLAFKMKLEENQEKHMLMMKKSDF